MKVNHTISSIDKSTGGPARSVTHLLFSMMNENVSLKIELETIESKNPIISKFAKSNSSIRFHSSNKIGYSKSLKQQLLKSDVQLFHGHGLWQASIHQMAKIAFSRNIPYIITPRGMLESWSLEQGKIKKKIALKIYQYKDLQNAMCLHATAPMEVDSIRALGLKNPVAMIPNGVNIEDFPRNFPEKENTPRKILFLSRIHPKKGIELLIEAWSKLDARIKNNWIINVVGNGDAAYISELKIKIKMANLDSQILIKPPVFGEEKIELFRESSLFVLPTYSENFGIVIAEALASYTPVITTKGTPWEELNITNSGWWIDIGVEPLMAALVDAMQINDEALKIKGENGRSLIERKYSMESVAKQMIQLYDWILNKKDKPNFVS